MNEAHPCVDKRVYILKYKAQAKAERAGKRFKNQMRVYECPRCGFYHLARVKGAAIG